MIGFLKGEIYEVAEKSLILMVGGVGYKVVMVSEGLEKGAGLEVYVHTYVKEDELTLYGFRDKKQLKLFQMLISVSGVGPKMAMNVLNRGKAEEVQKAVAMADVGFFTSVSGIGKKNAQRIIVDLKSKLGDLAELDLTETDGGELVQALMSMGFGRREVEEVLRGLPAGMREEEKVREVIKKLGR